MIVKVYDDASSGIKLYTFVILNVYTGTVLMRQARPGCQLLLIYLRPSSQHPYKTVLFFCLYG